MKKKRQYIVIIIILFGAFSKINGQEPNDKVVFEQKALDFFADSILNRIEPFKKFVAYFDGVVDSSITTIQYEMIKKYPNDTLLINEYYKTEKAGRTEEFWKNNKRPTFLLNVKNPIRKIHGQGNLRVLQYENVGKRNYVWFEIFMKDEDFGYGIYFTMDNNGKILNWYYDKFRF
jgi:hypothetical protein